MKNNRSVKEDKSKKRNLMMLFAVLLLIIVITVLVYLLWPEIHSLFKGDSVKKLEFKIAEIVDLRNQLSIKQEHTIALIKDYENTAYSLKQEIKELSQKNRLDSYQQAIKDPRINYNLVLIQQVEAYTDNLNKIAKRLTSGIYELEFISRKTSIDLKMARVFKESGIEKLIQDINKVINEYLPDADNLIIKDKDLKIKPLDKIWQEILDE